MRTIRLKKATHIMTHEDVTMNDVAIRIGMQSTSHFSRVFKKRIRQIATAVYAVAKKDNFRSRPL
ncbi:MAG TPA: AraC family transcriptional regulator [Puia sp.]|nr:AraC family transcriptional regulator [Puia sp.]